MGAGVLFNHRFLWLDRFLGMVEEGAAWVDDK